MKHICQSLLALVMTATMFAGGAQAQSNTVTVHAADTREPISPYVYGQFIEHLGRCIYGGIWAEMLEDRKFYYPVDGQGPGWSMHAGKKVSFEGEGIPYEILSASPWQIVGPVHAVSMSKDAPYVGEHTPVITLDGSAEPRGIYHPRLAVEQGRGYTGYLVAKAARGVTRIEVALQWGTEPGMESVATFEAPGDTYTKLPFTFTGGGNSDDGRLVIRALGTGAVHVGTVSLMPSDNVDGFRKDTLALLRELNSPVYRWPGGNFVSGYDWRDGVGERDKRPPRKNPAWTGIEHNDVGIHEFMRLCELIDTEPYVALNTGLGDVSSAAEEVAYITAAADTAQGARRAANGRTEPWDVQWWAVGNEMYGEWQLGHMPLEDYVKKHNAVVDAIRAVSPKAQCIGVGAVGNWSEAMLANCSDHMRLLSEHIYWQRRDEVEEHVEVAAQDIDRIAKAHRKYRDEISALEGKDIRLALDEWNYWYGPNIYGELGTRYFHRDALGAATALHAMFRNSDLYFMANYAQTVNVIGAIKTTRTSAFLESTGQVLKLYRAHFGSIPVTVDESLHGLDMAAAWTEDRATLTVSAVNATGSPMTVALTVEGESLPEKLDGFTIQHDDPEAHNDESNPNKIVAKESSFANDAGKITFAPYSINLLRVPKSQN